MYISKRLLTLVLLTLAFTTTLPAEQVIVPGTANPWLAGATNGTTASGGDVAPSESPVVYTNLTAGSALYFSATGSAGYSPGSESGPDGVAGFYVSDPEQNGVGAMNNAQANALLGVFLDNAMPTGSTPAPLDFGPSGLGDYQTLSPALKQPFVIGSGFTADGVPRAIFVPAGATRLFLGICDGSGWFNNTGSFTVQVGSAIAPPLRLVSSGNNFDVHWPASYTNCVVQLNTSVATTNWVTLTNTPILSGSEFVITNVGGASIGFYRLLCH